MLWVFKAYWKKIISLLLFFIIILLVIGIIIPPYSGYSSTSIFSDSWKGHSEMFKIVSSLRPSKVLYHMNNLKTKDILVIVSPNENVSVAPVISHIKRGGKVVIIDSSKYTEKLLSSLDVHKNPGPIVDKENFYRREDAPLIKFKKGWVAFKHTYSLKCHQHDSKKLLESSNLSWTDNDGDHKITQSDELGPHCPAIALKYNSTEYNVVIVADRFIFSNDMIHEKDNIKFLEYIFDFLDPRKKDSIIFYEGDKARPNSLVNIYLSLSQYLNSPYFIGGTVLGFLIFIYILSKIVSENIIEGNTLYRRLIKGVHKNIGKRKEPYVWIMNKLYTRLSEEIDNLKEKDVDPKDIADAKKLLNELKGKKFEDMNVITLENKIKETSQIILKLSKAKNKIKKV